MTSDEFHILAREKLEPEFRVVVRDWLAMTGVKVTAINANILVGSLLLTARQAIVAHGHGEPEQPAQKKKI
jgi:hypothetical protein